jgi:parallel beta-helix repeat protein
MKTLLLSALLAGFLPLTALPQGQLPPPPGPPGPTMKTLDQLDSKLEKRIPISSIPVDITKPGSYYLTQNLSGAAPGIVAKVSGVTIDLNGFTITGPGKGLAGTGSGIVGLNDTVVRNGRVSDFGDDGIHLGAAGIVDNVDVVNVGGACITVGEQSRVQRCRVGAGDQGIVTGDSSLVESVISIANSGASPKAGIVVGAYCVISGCTSSYNSGQGFVAGNGATLSNLTASNNSGANAILALDGSTLTSCTAVLNTANGIKVGRGGTLIGCTAKSNALDGIVPGDGSTVSKCTVRENGHNGINVANACTVESNTAQTNGIGPSGSGSGIFVTGDGNRIDGNHFTFHADPANGLTVTGVGNLIIRNTSHGNSNDYAILAGNRFGPVIDITALSFQGASGKSAPDTTTSTHPWANFVY